MMYRSTFLLAILLVVSITFSTANASPKLMDKLVKQYTDNTKQRLAKTGRCTARNLVVREEWYVDPVNLYLIDPCKTSRL